MDRQELYIENQLVELTEDVAVALNFAITDIAEPEKVKADYSKTITLPGSTKINQIFSHIYNVNVDLEHSSATFNPNIRAEARYSINSVELIDGFLQLKKINIKDGCITYDVNLFGRNANLFNDIGEKLMTELDISEFNHDWTLQNEEDSWATQIIEGGVPVPFALGNGYVYPMIDYGYTEDEDQWKVTEFFPSVYVKTYMDKIFEDAGYSYNSTFLNSTYFKSLIIPASRNLKLTTQQIEDRKCIVNTASIITPTLNRTGISTFQPITFTTEVQDNLNQITVPSTTITVSQSGIYNLIGEVNYNAEFICNTIGVSVNSLVTARATIQVLVNGVLQAGRQMNIQAINPFITSYTTAINPTPPSAEYSDTFNPASVSIATHNGISLQSGDTITMQVLYSLLRIGTAIVPPPYSVFDLFEDATTPGTYYTGQVDLNIRAADLRIIPVGSNLVEGNSIDMNGMIPEEIKQKEFVKAIINMHNLYVQPDRDNPKILEIEPRDDFYTSDVVDWSQKLDTSNDILIEPLGALKFRDFEFTYKSDKDYYNELYEDTYNEIYGYRRVILDNEFLRGSKKIEVVFSPTPIIGDFDHDRIYPEIFKTDNDNNKVEVDHNTRILYYGGLKATNNSWLHTSTTVADVTRTDYAYAGHLDDPYNPTLDLNWGLTREVFYSGNFATVYGTIAGLVNKYYFNYIREISNENSKIVTAYFNLNAKDINELSFKKQYFFNNSYYRLQQVVDYSPLQRRLTKCVFIKLADIIPFVDAPFIINGGSGSVTGGIDNEPLPSFDQPFKDNNTR
jgi:hypothetical protein